MTTATISCDQCTRGIPTESAVYSSAGKLLCPSCHDAASTIETDRASASSRRKVNMGLGVAAVLLLLASSAMLAAGRGELLGRTLLGLAVLSMGISAAGLFLRFRVRYGIWLDLATPRGTDPSVYTRGAMRFLFIGIFFSFAGVTVLKIVSLSQPPPLTNEEWIRARINSYSSSRPTSPSP